MGPTTDAANPPGHYHHAMADIQRELRRPNTQRRVFSLTQTTPTDLVRSKLSTSEIQSRALSSLPDDLLANIPDDSSSYSLFEGFQVSQDDYEFRKAHRRRSSKNKKLLEGGDSRAALPSGPAELKQERDLLARRMERMGVRKNMCSSEIHDIDNKIANLHTMRKIVLDRLAGLETEEADLEHECIFYDLSSFFLINGTNPSSDRVGEQVGGYRGGNHPDPLGDPQTRRKRRRDPGHGRSGHGCLVHVRIYLSEAALP